RMTLDARSFSTPNVLRMMKAFNSAAVDTRGGWQPSLSLSLSILGERLNLKKSTHFQTSNDSRLTHLLSSR
ncbi:MAG: hypothetical protein M1282_11295, partial [Chloroflexi bacterium]|nr:hypothetical protein [Chloroflexota bacterium]